MWQRSLVITLACVWALGCDPGAGHPQPSAGGHEPTNVFFDESVDCTGAEVDPGPEYVRRLTNEEYVLTLRDVLGVDVADLRARLPKDLYTAGFQNNATSLSVSGRRAEQYAYLAGQVARRLDSAWIAEQGECTLGERACERRFLREVGLRLFRRPMTDAEIARFARLFRVVESQGDDFERAARLVVEAMVQAPQFLYRMAPNTPELRLPSRTLAADAFEPDGPGRRSAKVELAAGRYRLDVRASAARTDIVRDVDKPGRLEVALDATSIHGWDVDGRVASAYATSFEIGQEQAGTHRLVLDGDGVGVASVELIGPMAAAFDLGGDDAHDGVRPLDDFELASRLSYFIWHSAPDNELLAAAAAGQVHTPEQLDAQARRMLDDPRARRALRDYLDQWLRLDLLDTVERDAQAFPEFGDELVAAMKQETYRRFEAVIWEDHADMLSVFAGEHAGLLTHASILTLTASGDETSPTHRGLYVRTRFLCQPVGPPPANSNTEPPEVTAGVSKRELFAQHTEDPQCAYCHKKMDPIGFALENYDAIGAWRTHDEAGEPIDAHGSIEIGGDRIDFDGAAELGQVLRESDAVEECMVQNVYQYAVGRPPRRDDVCDMRQVRQGFVDGGRSYQALVRAVVASDAFRYVRVHQD